MTNEEIGSRIKSERESQGMTLKDVADKIGVATSTIQRYEAGAIQKIKLPVIEAIAKNLGVNPAWLVGKSDDKRLPKSKRMDDDAAYYLDEETRKIAQDIYEDKDLRILMDASRKLDKKDIDFIVEMVRKIKGE